MSRSEAIYTPPRYTSPEIVYEDDYLLAVNKPAGLLSVPGRGPGKSDCLSARVQLNYPEARIVHRLDMETSGLMLFARSPETQRQLGKLFEARKIRKTYIAVVHGKTRTKSGTIDLPLIADWPNRPLQKVDFKHGKPSQTKFALLEYEAESDRTRLQLEPVSGRSHQLRVHLHSIGHPILGDRLYQSPVFESQSERLMLHASRLEFQHPQTSAFLAISCPAPF
jgi:tRNA pseudouridine32 synthase/23S rRNA pseudouridine746 synthase